MKRVWGWLEKANGIGKCWGKSERGAMIARALAGFPFGLNPMLGVGNIVFLVPFFFFSSRTFPLHRALGEASLFVPLLCSQYGSVCSAEEEETE